MVAMDGGTNRMVGMIGLGAMGRPMANNMLAAGCSVVCYDRFPAAIERLVDDGAEGEDSAAAVASRAEILFTMLPEASDVRDALLGPDGAVEGARDGTIFIDTSTIDPMSIQDIGNQVAAHGITMLDGGVSGSPEMARTGTVTLMVGGPRAAFDRCRPVLEAISGTLIHTGDLGSAKVVKLVNNMVGAISMASVAEAFVLAQRSGVAPEVLYEAMMGSWGRCFNLEVRPPYAGLADGSPANEGFAPDFSVDYMVKDLSYALRTAERFRSFVGLTAMTHQLFVAASAAGDGSKDISIVGKALERLSGSSPR